MIWEEIVDYYFSPGIPHGEYIFMVVIVAVCAVAVWRSRKMVSDI